MSEKDKKPKPAARDISDLKARLGLKKGTPNVQVSGGGVPPPSSAKIGGFVPPPPGVAGAPQAPPPIDASEDPFGAMNQMARNAAPAAQPQFVIVDDGKPVAQVSSTARMMRYVKWTVIIITPLLVGYVFGGINHANSAWNKTVDDAKRLFTDFDTVGKGLQQLSDTIDSNRAKDQSLKPNDMKLTTEMEALGLAELDPTILFHSNLYLMDAEVVQRVFAFYSDVSVLYKKVKFHTTYTRADSKRAERLMPDFQFAALWHVPKEEDDFKAPYFEFVSLGAFKCDEAQKGFSKEACPGGAPPVRFQISSDNVNWQKDVAVAKPAGPADNELVLMPLNFKQNAVSKAIFAGADKFVDTVAYNKRMQEIDEEVKRLTAERAAIQTILNTEAQRAKRFSL